LKGEKVKLACSLIIVTFVNLLFHLSAGKGKRGGFVALIFVSRSFLREYLGIEKAIFSILVLSISTQTYLAYD
ncbi:MAG: hypothetical protein H8E82_05715, partial [Candidatus Marinimicrobia bacterium]|nr:hypothetical protein [Candidatus Neomarinimicrobiota bacterium]